jgi:hypothetical protein
MRREVCEERYADRHRERERGTWREVPWMLDKAHTRITDVHRIVGTHSQLGFGCSFVRRNLQESAVVFELKIIQLDDGCFVK